MSLVYGLFQSSLCAYMFGWHVHEKALIVSLVLLALVAVEHPRYGETCMMTCRRASTRPASFGRP